MNANLYELKTKNANNGKGNGSLWLVAGLVVVVVLAAAVALRALTSTPAQTQAQTAAASAQGAAANPAVTLALPQVNANGARHGTACDQLPAGTPGCFSLAVSAADARPIADPICKPVSRAAQHRGLLTDDSCAGMAGQP